MSVFRREAGTSTLGWRAASPLRIRVSISAMGSDVVIPSFFLLPSLPGSLDHAGNFARERQLAEADAAQLKLPEESPRPAAAEAAVAVPAAQLGRILSLRDCEP